MRRGKWVKKGGLLRVYMCIYTELRKLFTYLYKNGILGR